MKNNLATLIDSVPTHTLYVLVRWPFFEPLKKYSWFDEECVYYATWDVESIFKAYFVPVERLLELHDRSNSDSFQFTPT